MQQQRWSELVTKNSKGLGICFGIRSMLPVMAEAYVNLMMFVLFRQHIKDDSRLRDHTIKQPIDIRIKTLHTNCIGFSKPVDYSNDSCKAYHTLVNERNDLLHGNVVIDKLKFSEVYFLGKIILGIWEYQRVMWWCGRTPGQNPLSQLLSAATGDCPCFEVFVRRGASAISAGVTVPPVKLQVQIANSVSTLWICGRRFNSVNPSSFDYVNVENH